MAGNTKTPLPVSLSPSIRQGGRMGRGRGVGVFLTPALKRWAIFRIYTQIHKTGQIYNKMFQIRPVLEHFVVKTAIFYNNLILNKKIKRFYPGFDTKLTSKGFLISK